MYALLLMEINQIHCSIGFTTAFLRYLQLLLANTFEILGIPDLHSSHLNGSSTFSPTQDLWK